MSAIASKVRLAAGRLLGGHPGLYLFLAVACLNFASMGREVPWGDARPVFEVAVSMVQGRGVSVPTRWPADAEPGRDGKFYGPHPWLPSLLHVPGAALRAVFQKINVGPDVAHLVDVLACHLAGGLLGALTAWLFFLLCLRHGASLKVARWAAILLVLGSMVWVYARSPFTEIVQVVCFTGFFLELSQLLRKLDRRTALAAGLWAGMLINTKYIYVLAMPGALAVVAFEHRRDWRQLLHSVGFVALGCVPGALMLLSYNYIRFGSITKTGYTNVAGVMVENVLVSTWGFLFSPGKSIFLYTPPLVLSVLGLGRFWRGHRSTVLAMVATILPVMFVYLRFPAWPGDWSWGPRYVVFAIPVLLLPAIAFLSAARWPGRSLAAVILVVGLCVQLLGNAFYWDHFLRIALEVRTRWLGQANRSASLTADKGGFCEGCFEDVYPTVWLAPLQPILGHFWLLRHVPFEDSYQEAAEDAPWRRHTRLALDLKGTYERARVDHWFYDTRQHRVAGWFVLIFLLGGTVGAGAMFVRRTRDPDAGPDDDLPRQPSSPLL